MPSNLPTGTVTFLFTDIAGSAQLWERDPDEMNAALAKHDSLLKDVIAAHHGYVVKTTGDGVHAVFTTALDGVNAAIAAQRGLRQISEVFSAAGDSPFLVRMGLHTGEAELRDQDYYGGTLNRAARIMSLGHGGQVLVSETTLQLALDRLPGGVSTLDLGYHQLKGLHRAEHIFQLNAPGLPQEFPRLKSQTHAAHNLPTQLTSFIGREREMAEAQARLEHARLLTLIGPGGTGKTRLSIQLGAKLLSTFEDGVWLVELAPLVDPAHILPTVASVLDIGQAPGTPLEALVLDYLREKHLLLILDNCEHLIEASAKVADEFLHIAAHIKIIASSREALGISGETVYRVPSLSLPEQAAVTPEAAMGFEAVQLFVERASAANPRFELTDENAASVAQICARLDGIPLAIELAASRLTVFAPEQIAKRLDDRFRLLTGGSRTALPRQQTLRALIDWSHDLLGADERALLRRLSVFAGGWTFEAAETICSNLDVFEHLPQLVNKSLVTVKDEGGEPRYFLLETIRQYGREKLLDSGEGEETRNRHLAYFLEMAETAMPEMLTRAKELAWIKKLRIEYDNIRAAIEWGLTSHPVAAMRLVRSLTFWFVVTGYASEGHRWGEAALENIEAWAGRGQSLTAEENLHRARLAASLSIISFSMGDNRAAALEAEAAIGWLRPVDDQWSLTMAFAIQTLGNLMLGKTDEAIAAGGVALELAERLGDKYVLGTVLGAASNLEAFVHKDFAKADALREKAVALLKEHGNRWSYGINMYWFGILAVMQKQFEKARVRFKIARQTMQEIGSSRTVNMIDSDLAHILRYEGNYPQAIAAYHETIKEWQRMGHRAAVAHELECLAFAAIDLGETGRAARLLGAAEALRRRVEIDMTPLEREEYDREVSELKANMDEQEFASLWADGRSMTMEEAVEFALGA